MEYHVHTYDRKSGQRRTIVVYSRWIADRALNAANREGLIASIHEEQTCPHCSGTVFDAESVTQRFTYSPIWVCCNCKTEISR